MRKTYFEEHWIHIGEHAYVILDSWLSQLLDEWYTKNKNDEKLEYLIKFFQMFRPRSKDVALHYITILEKVLEEPTCKEIINMVYQTKKVNQVSI